MSEAQKPVEEIPVVAPAVEATPLAAEPQAPVTEVPAATEAPVVDAPQEPAAPVEETAKEEPKVEVTPATDGVLGYKAPGLVKYVLRVSTCCCSRLM